MWASIGGKNRPVGSIRILSVNSNSLPIRSRDNYKVDHLMIREYNPDTVDLQQLCQNPYASKASMAVVDMLRTRE